jgi:hypothetical protein
MLDSLARAIARGDTGRAEAAASIATFASGNEHDTYH